MNALPALVCVPLAGASIIWLTDRLSATRRSGPWAITLMTLTLELLLLLWASFQGTSHQGPWLNHFSIPWVPPLGIAFRLDMDGLSLSMLWLTILLSLACVLLTTRHIRDSSGTFHALLLATISGTVGTFLATDLFLFFFFWELMLVPVFFLLCGWGHESRYRAAIKFFLFTQGSGLLMLLSILGLVIINFQETGILTFDYFVLANTHLSPLLSMLLMLGFFIPFAVKLPVVPVHVWLPDTHTQAPTAGSVILAGILLKTGGYGMIRFNLMLFPEAVERFAPYAMLLGLMGILYGAWLACAQSDIKRLIAYSSISHLGFVMLGIFSVSPAGLQGAIIQMLAHGLSTGGLFIIAGAIQDRLHTRDIVTIDGLWESMPRLSSVGLFFAIASLGIPGLGNFAGEFLVLLATWSVSPFIAILATGGLILASVYSLKLVNGVFLAPSSSRAEPVSDFHAGQMSILGILMTLLVILGLYPQPIMTFSLPSPATITTSNSGKNAS